MIAPDLRSRGESDTGLSFFHTGLVADVMNLIDSLGSLPQGNATNFGLRGHRMGGGIATKVLVIAGYRVKAAVLNAPNSADAADLIGRWGPGCVPGETASAGGRCNPAEIIPPGAPEDLVRAYLDAVEDSDFLRQVAPLYHLDAVSAPVQIHFGTADGRFLLETPPLWAEKLADALPAEGKEVTLFAYTGQGHSFTGTSGTLLLSRATEFFAAQLSN